MGLKGYLLIALAVLALAAGAVYKAGQVIDLIEEQAAEIKTVSKERDDLKTANNELKTQIAQIKADELEKADINEKLRQDIKNSSKDFQDLKNELALLRQTQSEVKPNSDNKPNVASPTVELDLAWRAYCKALPGGCPQGAGP